jgi:hypothetical protein
MKEGSSTILACMQIRATKIAHTEEELAEYINKGYDFIAELKSGPLVK